MLYNSTNKLKAHNSRLFFFKICLFILERERTQVGGEEGEEKRISSRLHTKPDMELNLPEITT